MQKWTIIIGKRSFTISRLQVFLLFLPVFSILSFSIYSYGEIIHSAIININRSRVYSEKRFYTREIAELNRLINEVERRHSRIFRFDETMRLTLNIPKSDDIRMFGTGGRYHPSKGGRILESKGGALNKRLELIKRGVAITEESLAEVDYNLRSSRKQLKHIPSIMPTWGRITSGFGWRNDPFTGRRAFHNGLDIANRPGTPVIATASGVVVYVGRMGNLGLTVRINHGYGYTTLYGHLKSFAVELYDRVERRDIIGYMGSTGRSTGPHLHYIVQKYGKDINPMNYILFGNIIY